MAIDKLIHCRACKESRMVTCGVGDYPDICDGCAAKAANKERRMFIAKFTAIPAKSAIRALAEEVWDLKNAPTRCSNELI